MSKLTLTEVVNAFQALEQKRAIRLEESSEEVFEARLKEKQFGSNGGKKQSRVRREKRSI